MEPRNSIRAMGFLKAYETLMLFANEHGEGAIRLAMHAAVPQSFRPELLHLLKLNFVPEALDNPVVEADILLSQLCEDLGAGYFQFDPDVKELLLDSLASTYESEDIPRINRVANFLLWYIDHRTHNVYERQDKLSRNFLATQKWVALAYLDPEAAAVQLAAAIDQTNEQNRYSTRAYIGGLANTLSVTLMRHHELLTYAIGLQALEDGDFEVARELLESLGNQPVKVGDITLRPATQILFDWLSPAKRVQSDTSVESSAEEGPVEFEPVFNELLFTAANNLQEFTSCDAVVLYTYSELSGHISLPPIMLGVNYPTEINRVSEAELVKDSIIYAVLDNDLPYIAENIQDDPLFRESIFVKREEIKSSVAIPLVANGSKVGIVFLNYRSQQDFSTERLSSITSYTDQLALTIQNMFLYEQAEHSKAFLTAINNFTQEINAITGKESDSIFSLLHKYISELISFTVFYIALYDAETDMISFPFATEYDLPVNVDQGEWANRRGANGLTEYVIRTKKPLLIQEDVEKWLQNQGIDLIGPIPSAWLGAPMLVGQNILGIVGISSNQKNAFEKRALDQIAILASQAGLAIYKALSPIEFSSVSTSRKNTEKEIAAEIEYLIRTNASVNTILSEIATRVAGFLNCDHCTIFLLETVNDQSVLIPKVISGPENKAPLDRQFKMGEGIVGLVAETGNAMIIPDARSDSHFAPARTSFDFPRSMLIVPIKSGSQVLGVINADKTASHWFSERDLSLLEKLAQYASVAIGKERNQELLRRIEDAIENAENLNQTLGTIVSAVVEMMNASSCVLYLIKDDDNFAINNAYGYPANLPYIPPRLDNLTGITRTILKTRRSLAITDLATDNRVNPKLLEHYKSMVAVPLISRDDKVIGVLFLNSIQHRNFSNDELNLLSQVASSAAAVAIKLNQKHDIIRHCQKIASTLAMSLEGLDNYVDLQAKRMPLDAMPIDESMALVESQSVISILRNNNRLIILGGAGTGKTATLARFAWELASAEPPIIPILIKLRQYDGQTLLEWIWLELSSIGEIKISNIEDVQSFLNNMPLDSYLLLDGLDEVPPIHREQLLNEINNFGRVFPKVSIAITSRPEDDLWRQLRKVGIIDKAYLLPPPSKAVSGTLGDLRKQAKQMQEELRAETITAQNDSFIVNISGDQRVLSIEGGKDLPYDLVVELVNQALKQSQELADKGLQSLTDGLLEQNLDNNLLGQAKQLQTHLANQQITLEQEDVKVDMTGDQKLVGLWVIGQPQDELIDVINEVISLSLKLAGEKLQEMTDSDNAIVRLKKWTDSSPD